MYLHGYALKWHEIAFIPEEHGAFYEQFVPGAFQRTISTGEPVGYLDHKYPLKEVEFSIVEDSVGLAFEMKLNPNDPVHREVFNAVSRGKLRHASVFFKSRKETKSTYCNREFKQIAQADLLEISLVEVPAYKTSCVSIGRSKRNELLAKIDQILKKVN